MQFNTEHADKNRFDKWLQNLVSNEVFKERIHFYEQYSCNRGKVRKFEIFFSRFLKLEWFERVDLCIN